MINYKELFSTINKCLFCPNSETILSWKFKCIVMILESMDKLMDIPKGLAPTVKYAHIWYWEQAPEIYPSATNIYWSHKSKHKKKEVTRLKSAVNFWSYRPDTSICFEKKSFFMTVTLNLNEISPKSKGFVLTWYITRSLRFFFNCPETSILREKSSLPPVTLNKISSNSIGISLFWYVTLLQSFIWIGYKLSQLSFGNQCWRSPACHYQTNSRV